MREFFCGWRRKVGCVALLSSVCFMGIWLRGFVIQDVFHFGSGCENVYDSIVANRDGYRWETMIDDDLQLYVPGWNSKQLTLAPDDPVAAYAIPAEIEWRWKSCGFDFGQLHSEDYPTSIMTWRTIPHWVIAIPLTMLSAYLLLWLPRKRTGAEHA